MKQNSFAFDGFEKYRKKTRKETFLEEMDQIVPWKEMTKAIGPYYPKVLVVVQLVWKECYAFIFYNTGLSYQIQVLKKDCMTHG